MMPADLIHKQWDAAPLPMGCEGNHVGSSGCYLSYLTPLSNHLSSVLGPRSQKPLKRHIFSSDVGVQTETVVITPAMQPPIYEQLSNEDTVTDDSDMSPLSLSVTDLSSILKWSKEISSDINLAAGWRVGNSNKSPLTFLQLSNDLLRSQPVGLPFS